MGTDGWTSVVQAAQGPAQGALLQLAPTPTSSCCHRDVPGSCPLNGGVSYHPHSPSTRRAPQIPTAVGCGVRSRDVSCCRRYDGPCSAAPPRACAGCRAPLPIPGCPGLHPRVGTGCTDTGPGLGAAQGHGVRGAPEAHLMLRRGLVLCTWTSHMGQYLFVSR